MVSKHINVNLYRNYARMIIITGASILKLLALALAMCRKTLTGRIYSYRDSVSSTTCSYKTNPTNWYAIELPSHILRRLL